MASHSGLNWMTDWRSPAPDLTMSKASILQWPLGNEEAEEEDDEEQEKSEGLAAEERR